MARMEAQSFAVFRFDAGIRLGSGHAVRCLALADALERRGWRCGLAIGAGSAGAIPGLAQRTEDVVELSSSEADRGTGEAAVLRAQWPDGCALLVVDHYSLDAVFETACRPWAATILVIDDLADRPHDCDFLTDAAPGRAASNYEALTPHHCRLLIGGAYALLRSEFAACREILLPRATASTPTRLLISLGATDPDNVSATVIEAVALSGLALDFDVMLGAASRHIPAIEDQASALGGKVHVDVDDMPKKISEADFAVGAGGLSALERCCLGLPTILLPTAANQRCNTIGLAAAGAVVMIDTPTNAPRIAAALAELASNRAARAAMSQAGAALCDGRGVARLAMMLGPAQTARDGLAVTVRSATQDDRDILLNWQRHPATRRYARTQAAPTKSEHSDWLSAKLANPGCIFNMILHGGHAAGVVRLDRQKAGNCYEVSISVDPERHGLGIASAALALVRDMLPEAGLLAHIDPTNSVSLALFGNVGYRATGEAGWYALPPVPVIGESDRTSYR